MKIELYIEKNKKKYFGERQIIDIGFKQFLKKSCTEIKNIYFKGDITSKYEINCLVEAAYNIDTYEMYDLSSKEHELYSSLLDKIVHQNNWHYDEENARENFRKYENKVTEETRISLECFNFEITFDNLDEMIDFIKYYDKVDENKNILEDFYHLIFIEKKDYKNYLKTKHWKEKRKNILKNAKYKCQLCSCKDSLHVHHNTYKNIGNEKKEDLIVLCSRCHSKFHDK